jgi:hypothetical protein
MRDLADVRVIVFDPLATPETSPSTRTGRIPVMTPGRAALIGLIDRLHRESLAGPSPS